MRRTISAPCRNAQGRYREALALFEEAKGRERVMAKTTNHDDRTRPSRTTNARGNVDVCFAPLPTVDDANWISVSMTGAGSSSCHHISGRWDSPVVQPMKVSAPAAFPR
jgi:hypothetical protein